MSSLAGMRVASLETRMSDEMTNLLRRHGGTPYSVPAVREAALESQDAVSACIEHLTQGKIQVVIFLTGAGVTAFFKEAEAQNSLPQLLAALHNVTIICRGPKPAAVLKRYAVPITTSAHAAQTTEELLNRLSKLDLQGKGVAIVHYGERNATLTQALQQKGIGFLDELCLYEWQLPEDLGPLRTLIDEIIEQRVNAIVFTSQVQVRHLLQVASDVQKEEQLVSALNTKTIVASIGPTCTAALQAHGIRAHVIPEYPKMGHLVKALVDYIAETTQAQ
ncbi:uroporphyrinogen-III synthase [Ktedonosporobacter rubrisoli]|nr:uroporphyrinogen-III synthase [Ktedonosporobacter rubrisoli]